MFCNVVVFVSFVPVVIFVVMRKLQKVIFGLPHVTMQMRMSFPNFVEKGTFFFFAKPCLQKAPQKNAQPKEFVVKKKVWK